MIHNVKSKIIKIIDNLNLTDLEVIPKDKDSVKHFAKEVLSRVGSSGIRIIPGGSEIMFSILIEVNTDKVLLKISDVNIREMIIYKLSIDEFHYRIPQPFFIDDKTIYLNTIEIYSLGQIKTKSRNFSFIVQPFIEGLDRSKPFQFTQLILKIQKFLATNGFIVDSFPRNWFVAPDQLQQNLYDVLYYDLLLFNDPEMLETSFNITETLIGEGDW